MNHESPTPSQAPDIEPGVVNALRRGWHSMKNNFLVYFLAVLVLAVFLFPTDMGGDKEQGGSGLMSLLETAYLLLLYPIINYGVDLLFLRGVRGDNVEVKSLFDGFKNYVNIILASLLVMGLVFIGLIVLIVPGIYVGCRLIFVAYLVMDEELDPIAAVEASWRLTRGHTLKIFLLGVTSIFLFFFGLLLLLIGALPALMWIKASFAALYLSITQHKHAEPLGVE